MRNFSVSQIYFYFFFRIVFLGISTRLLFRDFESLDKFFFCRFPIIKVQNTLLRLPNSIYLSYFIPPATAAINIKS